MNKFKFLILSTALTVTVSGNPVDPSNDPLSSWENVPEIINSITDTDYRGQLEELHRLTLIKLGYPQASQGLSDSEHRLYMIQTRDRWKEWWASTGNEIAKARKLGAKIDQEAFKVAWDFLGGNLEQPKTILPVWIPESWTLYVTFTNGDYAGQEKEVWLIRRKFSAVNFTKLRGEYSKGLLAWDVALTKLEDMTPELADQTLKALCYLHHYAPATGTEVPGNELEKLYYPHATLHLMDEKDRILWNTDGYDFTKTIPVCGNGEAGRSYYFLKTLFSNTERWKQLSKPTSEELAPYRDLLSFSKPYFFNHASDIIQLFGRVGASPEKEAMLEWSAKEKAATNQKMNWEMRCCDFSTELKVNVIGSTQFELKQTLAEIKKIESRTAKEGENRQGEPPGNDKPTTKPADKAPAKDQPSTHSRSLAPGQV